MVERERLSRILRKKILREIRGNFKQFLALISIATLAVTLFVGLSSNARGLQKRLDQLYEDGNIADIFVYVSDYDERDMNKLREIPGVKAVEERFYLEDCKVHRGNGKIIIEEDDAKICVPAELEGTTGVVIDRLYASTNHLNIGDEIALSFPFRLTDYMSEDQKNLADLSDSFLIEGKENPLKTNLTFGGKITGLMLHPETVERESSSGTCLLNRSAFENLFRAKIEDAFQPWVADLVVSQASSFDLINQYLVRVDREASVKEVHDLVYGYFNPETSGESSSEIPEKRWGKYETEDREYTFYLDGEKIEYEGKEYLLQEIRGDVFLFEGGVKLDFSEGVLLTVGEMTLSFSRCDPVFITSLTKENLPSTAVVEQDIYQAKQLCVVFPTIFFIVAALVILTSLSQALYRSRQEIGTMKALGIPKRRILVHYIGLGITLSMIGAVLGSILGPLIIPNVMNAKYSILYDLPTIATVYPASSILLCIGLFIVLSSIVTFSVAWSEIRLNPVESMRPKKTGRFIKKKKEDRKNVSQGALSMRMAFRNILSKKSRMLMVVFGVAGCTALTVSGFGIIDTINYGLDMDLYETYQADLTLSYAPDRLCGDEIRAYPGVEEVQEYTSKMMRFQNGETTKDFLLYLYETSETPVYTFMNRIHEGIALSESVAEEFSLREGDTVRMIYLGKSYERTVDAIYRSSYWLSAYTFRENFPELPFVPSGANVRVENLKDSDALASALKENFSLVSCTSLSQFQKSIDDTLSTVRLMTNTVKIFAVLLAVVVTYNLASLNFTERKRDIATLKVLGFSAKEIGMSLVFELLFLTIIGTILGLFMGYPILYLILSINETTLLHYIYHIDMLTYLISAAITLGTAFAVNLYLAGMASKVDAVSALKSVE